MTRRARGFTLIEILVVITIVGLLMTFTVVAIGRYQQVGRTTDCQHLLTNLGLLANAYAERTGSYPPSRLADLGVEGANPVNEGIEAFVVALRRADYHGQRPDEDWLGNTDDDRAAGLGLFDGSDPLLEILDPWDQPIVYIDNASYGGEPVVVRLVGGDELTDTRVGAAKNPVTGTHHRYESFQLRSAGPDGIFDTDDDLANFELSTDTP